MFSPWYRLARRGGGGDPAAHCALNVALYGRGGRRWAMTERGASAVTRQTDHLQIGRSALRWEGGVLSINVDEITAPWPQRVRGTVKVFPEGLATHQVYLDGAGRHRWSPIAPGARVEVAFQQPDLRWRGTAYCDMNDGDEPLEEGFAGWHWCRAVLPDGMAVLYHGTRRAGDEFCTALRYDAFGNAEEFEAPASAPLAPSLWRVARRTRGEAARVVRTLEDTPFYARSVIATRLLGREVEAVHESLSLDRFVAPWVQMMLPFKAPRAVW